jgi:poly(hydroxyalkanoate) depolymerase family esterase
MTPIESKVLPDMQEAARLTREGRVTEATALLQRRFRGEASPGVTPEAARPTGTVDPTARLPRIFDVEPETGEVKKTAPLPQAAREGVSPWPSAGMGRTAPSPMPQALRGMLDQFKQGGLAQGTAGLSSSFAPGGFAANQVPLPDGARFETAAFAGDAGNLGYKLYVPSGYRAGQSVPLVVMLHGCTQSPDDFAAGTRMNTLAEEGTFLVMYPAQAASANAQRCWNWFSPSDQLRGKGEPALIAGATRQVMRDYAVDPRRVFVAGLSAGGAAAAIMGAAYPDLYAAVGVHSGLACGAARDMPSAFAAMRQGAAGRTPSARSGEAAAGGTARVIPTIVFHADKDGTVHPSNGDQVIAQAGAAASGKLPARVEQGQVGGGRSYTRSLYAPAGEAAVLEQWVVHGGGHAWSGGSTAGTYTDPRGPDASREMMRFFLEHPHPAPAQG